MKKPKAVVVPKKFQGIKPFSKRIAAGELCDVAVAAKLTGFSEPHLRRLCASEKIGHEKHIAGYYFTPAAIKAINKRVEPRA